MKTKHKISENLAVFDGYNNPLSTKTHEYLQRRAIPSPDINITDTGMQFTGTRKIFMCNTHRNSELTRILWQKFTEIDIENEQNVGDADVVTVK